MRRPPITTAAAVCLAILIIVLGCSEDVYIGPMGDNIAPTVRLTNGPFEGSKTDYQVHFYWLGHDVDGKIDHYEFTIVTGDPIGFNPDDTTGLDKWTKTVITDSIFVVKADDYDTTVTINNNLYGRYQKTHTFFIRAVDNRGAHSQAVHRSFTAWTLAPYANIRYPLNPNPGNTQVLGPLINFQWEARDPLDAPWNYQDVDSIRYFYRYYHLYLVDDLNKNPEKYEHEWSPWISYDAPGDSGKSTILGDDEILELGKSYSFVLQAKDDAGAVTSVFDSRTNVRQFIVVQPPGPRLTLKESYLGNITFIGTRYPPRYFHLPEAFVLKFSWEADASESGGSISTFRYGWNISDLSNPDEWDVSASPFHKSAPEKMLFSGTHTFYVEATDYLGTVTLGRIEITIFPLNMTRNLLFVDDFNSGPFNQTIYAYPTEMEHDDFWLDICSRADGFDPDCDVWDTKDQAYWMPPDIQHAWRYRNIVWVFSSEDRVYDLEGTAWCRMIKFVPDSYGGQRRFNYLSYYLEHGGHVWSSGKSDAAGGLAATLFQPFRMFPLYLKCEITGPQTGCSDDTSGVNTLAYKDYCVSVIDKVWASVRPNYGPPYKDLDHDALVSGIKDDSDPITAQHPGLPDELRLWDIIIRKGMFFDPQVRGFTYVEVYDPSYWMKRIHINPQTCLHPMYRMSTRNTKSILYNTTMAFWTTKYADVVAECPGTVAAPSVHFGVPLWFFNRDDVRAIADEIFKAWNISAEQ